MLVCFFIPIVNISIDVYIHIKQNRNYVNWWMVSIVNIQCNSVLPRLSEKYLKIKLLFIEYWSKNIH